MRKNIAYVVSRFPHLPETFILREMNEIERNGWEIALFPLIRQRQEIVHPEARSWLDRAHFLPFLSGDVIAANLRTLLRHPIKYLQLWLLAVSGNCTSPNFLVRAVALLPKAVFAAEKMRTMRIQHVHAHYATHPAFVAWAVRFLTGIPYSITVHAHDIFVRTAMLNRKLRDASLVVAISEFNRRYLAKKVGEWIRAKIEIVHCGIRPEAYPFHSRKWSDEPFRLITVGSLQPYKGQEYLVRACAMLRDKGVTFHCRIIGGGEELSNLESQIAELRLEQCVELVGAKTEDEVASLLGRAHCFVLPSIITPAGKMEGIPVALMEAMATGLPVVATELSGIPELVREGQTGLLVPPTDAAALADAIERVHALPEEASRRARAARELVLEEFELSKNVRDLSLLFDRFTPGDRTLRDNSGNGQLS